MKRLEVRVEKKFEADIRQGYPWVMAHMIVPSSALVISEPGELCDITTAQGKYLGTGYYNHRSKIAARVLTQQAGEAIDRRFFAGRLGLALAARNARYDVPYYRLVHSEGDGLPGLVVDRFGDVLVCQVSTLGMEKLQPLWMPELEALVAPTAIVMRNDIPTREKEGLRQEVRVLRGRITAPVEVQEYGVRYEADLLEGQKTGWFFDQRENRRWLATRAKGKRMLDVYCHTGGFGVAAAVAGAKHVVFVDSSKHALSLAQKNVALNGAKAMCDYRAEKAFDALPRLEKEGAQFEVVVLDPPAFVKQWRDREAGLKGYEKLARMGAPLVAPGGTLFVASCSHHAGREDFFRAVRSGVEKAGRGFEVIRKLGAAPDHPSHPLLPENDYLKAIALRLD
jgi:23S rRNA (cytosine1962-C5)-methyltransferase